MLIARLIADPATLETRLDVLRDAMADAGLRLAMARMLDHTGEVLHLSLPEGEPNLLLGLLDAHFAPSAALVAHGDISVPRLFVSDMDSTMIGQECIDELAAYAGVKPQIAAITERAMRGELDFEAALRERVALLAGLDENAIAQCLEDRIAPEPGARTLVATLKANGARCVLVTGGFYHFADPVAETLGFDHVVANRLEVANGKLTGGLLEPITDSATKRATLEAEIDRLGDGAIALATGDGANDIPMLKAAEYGFAYRAKPVAREAANGRIDKGGLTAILKLLDIPENDWVAG